ncbi:hypothetical protein C1646_768068, partial [Rhizophagus diaphanus]
MEPPLEVPFSIQNRLNNLSVSKDITNNNVLSNKPESLFQTVVKRAQVFEEFSKQISLELQTLYQEYLTHQIETELQITMNNIKKKNCKCKEQIEEQKQLINSLKGRIIKLESESITKNQEISKLNEDIDNFLEVNKLRTEGVNTIVKRKSVTFNDKILDEKNNYDDTIQYPSEESSFNTNTELKSIKLETKEDDEELKKPEKLKTTSFDYENENLSKQDDQIITPTTPMTPTTPTTPTIPTTPVISTIPTISTTHSIPTTPTTPTTPIYTITMDEIIRKYIDKVKKNDQQKQPKLEQEIYPVNQEIQENQDYNLKVVDNSYIESNWNDDDSDKNITNNDKWKTESQNDNISLNDYDSNKNINEVDNWKPWKSEEDTSLSDNHSRNVNDDDDNWKSERQDDDDTSLNDNNNNKHIYEEDDETSFNRNANGNANEGTSLNKNINERDSWGAWGSEEVSYNRNEQDSWGAWGSERASVNRNAKYENNLDSWRSEEVHDNHSRNIDENEDWRSRNQDDDVPYNAPLNHNDSNRN